MSDLAEHISLMAAPIYAAFLSRAIETRLNNDVPAAILIELRKQAIIQARALWLDTLDDAEPEKAP